MATETCTTCNFPRLTRHSHSGKAHPDDPLGPVSDAAAYLFAEFDRLHVLEFELFVQDSRFQKREKVSADPQVRKAFESDLAKCKEITDRILAHDPNNADALFASALSEGLRGDYLSLIEKKDLTALGSMKRAGLSPKSSSPHIPITMTLFGRGSRELPAQPEAGADAVAATMTGAQTDHTAGIEKLKITAEKGHYLQPYARLLLAVAALRDGNQSRADELLSGLTRQSPTTICTPWSLRSFSNGRIEDCWSRQRLS